MRIILLILASAVFAVSVISAVSNKQSNPVQASSSEVVAASWFPTTQIDLGERKRNSVVEGTFTIFNKGTADLYIENVLPNCHCTVATYSKNKIPAGDSSRIVLKYDSSLQGVFQSSAIVSTNASPSPTILILRGDIVD
jgi:hypothetical protein